MQNDLHVLEDRPQYGWWCELIVIDTEAIYWYIPWSLKCMPMRCSTQLNQHWTSAGCMGHSHPPSWTSWADFFAASASFCHWEPGTQSCAIEIEVIVLWQLMRSLIIKETYSTFLTSPKFAMKYEYRMILSSFPNGTFKMGCDVFSSKKHVDGVIIAGIGSYM